MQTILYSGSGLLLKIQELFTLCSNEWVMKMGTESCQKLSNGYLIIPVMGNEMIMYEIWVISNGRVMGMVLFCGSIMTMDIVMEKVPINITVIDNEIE